MSFPFTVVTALYDLKKREPHLERRNPLFYLEHGKALFELPVNIIMFTDPHLVKDIQELKRPEGYKTKIIPLPLEEVEFYKDLPNIVNLRIKNPIVNSNPSKDTPLFTVVQWSKFQFLEEAKKILELSPDFSEGRKYLLWVDFGLHYIAKDFNRILQFKPSQGNMKILCLRPTFPQEVNNPFFLRCINGRTGGGIISVPIDKVLEYTNLFRKTKENLLLKGFSPLEDEIMTVIRVNNPDLFDIYYGDYEDIVRNFNDECWSGPNIINLAFQWCLQFGDFKTIITIGEQIFKNRKELLKSMGPDLMKHFLSFYLSLMIADESNHGKSIRRVAKFIKKL